MVRVDDPYKKYSADGDVTGGLSCTTSTEGPAAQTGPKSFRIIGRTSTVKDDPAGATRIVWSGTTVSARVSGASQLFAKIGVTPEHVSGGMQTDALIDPPSIYYSVSIDGGPASLVTVDGTKSDAQVIQIASGLSGDHEITLVRESDGIAGAHFFYGLFTDSAGNTAPTYLPATVRARRIQIYGDSIAVGSGILGANASCTHSYDTERATGTFGVLAAAELDAEVSTVAIRPVGVVASSDPNTPWIMPNLYSCSDPRVTVDVSTLNGAALTCATPVDLTKDTSPPQVVVLALGTSDLVRAGAPVGDFQTAYETFLHTLRKTYPNAHIFCTLSPVLTDLNTQSQRTNAKNAIHTAVSDLADPKIYSLDFPDQGTENGLGCEENPSTKTHQIMADILATAIREKTCW
jgi:hypothetical protein